MILLILIKSNFNYKRIKRDENEILFKRVLKK